MSATRLSCPSCAATLKTAQPLPPGKVVKCPKCGTAFRVPADEVVVPAPKSAGPRPPAPPRPRPAPDEPEERPAPRKAAGKPARPAGNPTLFWSLVAGRAARLVVRRGPGGHGGPRVL